MALDIYVMPMSKFLAGDVTTATERLFGDSVQVIDAGGGDPRGGGVDLLMGRRLRKRIVAEASATLDLELDWVDQGDTVYAEQAPWGFEALRTYAKWLDLRDTYPALDDPPDGDFHTHPVFRHPRDGWRGRFDHLVEHNCDMGYYLPCWFHELVEVNPRYTADATLYDAIGSTHTLSEQLDALLEFIPVEIDGQVMPMMQGDQLSDECRTQVRRGFDQLRQVAALSIEHGLPIIFWG